MTELLSQSLFDKYPNLFSLKDSKGEPIGYGIECGDGWYDIIASLCFKISQHERNIESRNTYLIDQKQEPTIYSQFQFTQIKEKFGGLRIYSYGGDDYTSGLVAMAESWSFYTCENCGEKGKPVKGGWILTLCDKCRESK